MAIPLIATAVAMAMPNRALRVLCISAGLLEAIPRRGQPAPSYFVRARTESRERTRGLDVADPVLRDRPVDGVDRSLHHRDPPRPRLRFRGHRAGIRLLGPG